MGLPEKLLENLRTPEGDTPESLSRAVDSVENFAGTECLASLDRMLAFSDNFEGAEAIHSEAALSESNRITEMATVLNEEVVRFLSLHPSQES
ncbi:hypothetical protein [Fodinicurvata sediminis]|uniref:hypothetical protein n=1 Tax=Fodinicurvata sediminis TaxID=1121832 RepID=UPI0003B45A56|nr:hypothetical protein [Fodinicurvata sediminis]